MKHIVLVSFMALLVIAVGAFFLAPARGAYSRPQALILPDLIRCGKFDCMNYRSGDIDQFGQYSPEYYARRWKQLCKGAGRYTAMREAYEQGRPDPCNGAKEWRR